MADSTKKKKRTSAAQGGAPAAVRDAKDPLVYFGGQDADGNSISGAERASTMNIDPADVSPLNSTSRRAARSAATAKFDRSLDDQQKRRRMKQGASGVFGANRPGGAR